MLKTTLISISNLSVVPATSSRNTWTRNSGISRQRRGVLVGLPQRDALPLQEELHPTSRCMELVAFGSRLDYGRSLVVC
jgi:hypothetical protein